MKTEILLIIMLLCTCMGSVNLGKSIVIYIVFFLSLDI